MDHHQLLQFVMLGSGTYAARSLSAKMAAYGAAANIYRHGGMRQS